MCNAIELRKEIKRLAKKTTTLYAKINLFLNKAQKKNTDKEKLKDFLGNCETIKNTHKDLLLIPFLNEDDDDLELTEEERQEIWKEFLALTRTSTVLREALTSIDNPSIRNSTDLKANRVGHYLSHHFLHHPTGTPAT
jgi:hypothetical protein